MVAFSPYNINRRATNMRLNTRMIFIFTLYSTATSDVLLLCNLKFGGIRTENNRHEQIDG